MGFSIYNSFNHEDDDRKLVLSVRQFDELDRELKLPEENQKVTYKENQIISLRKGDYLRIGFSNDDIPPTPYFNAVNLIFSYAIHKTSMYTKKMHFIVGMSKQWELEIRFSEGELAWNYSYSEPEQKTLLRLSFKTYYGIEDNSKEVTEIDSGNISIGDDQQPPKHD